MNTSDQFVEAPKVIGDPSSSAQSDYVQQQHPDTCAIQCQRLILNQFGVGVTEDDLVQEATAQGIYNHGTSPDDVGKLLEDHGLPVHRYDNANVFNLSNELAQGHKVIVGVESDDLWHKNSILHEIADQLGWSKADHAVIVSGIDTSDPDHIKVNITDPGTGDVAKSYPIEQFMDAWKGSHFMMVSTAASAPNTLPEMANFPYDQGHIDSVGEAPYSFVQGLSDNVMPAIGAESFQTIESHFISVVNGEPIDIDVITQMDPFTGQEQIHTLFMPFDPAYHDLPGMNPVTNDFAFPAGPVNQDIFHQDDPFDRPLFDQLDAGYDPSHDNPMDHDPLHHDTGDDFFHNDI